MVIRQAKKEDIGQISDLEQKLLDYHKKFDEPVYATSIESRSSFSNWLSKRIEDENFISFVFTVNNKIFGYITGWIDERPPIYEIRKFGYLSNIFVDEKYRSGTGAAEDLAYRLFDWFKQKGIKYVKTSCDERNNTGLNFFYSLQFKNYSKTMLKILGKEE